MSNFEKAFLVIAATIWITVVSVSAMLGRAQTVRWEEFKKENQCELVRVEDNAQVINLGYVVEAYPSSAVMVLHPTHLRPTFAWKCKDNVLYQKGF